MPHRTFSIDEVCAYLHLAQKDVQTLVRRDGIPFAKRGDRLIFIQRDIDAWASQRILGFERASLQDYHRDTTAKSHDLSGTHAIITELFNNAFIETEIHARTKPSMLRRMVELAGRTGMVADPADLLKSLDEREQLYSTALTDGIALLHPRHHEPYMFEDSFIALGKAAHPLPFGAPDGKMTDIFFLICCQDDRIHLHVLARICMMSKHTRMIDRLRSAASPMAVVEAIRCSEDEIISGLRECV